jgi:glutaredoxin
MLILYTKDNCQYCDNVKRVFAERKIIHEERNIKNPEFLKEVQALEARTLPLLVDTTANTTVGESEEIIAYGSEYSF